MRKLTKHAYVVTDDAILSGEPIAVGTRTPVHAIVELRRQGVAPEAIFEALHGAYRAAGLHHTGITIAMRHPPYEIVRRLLLILNQVTADEMDDQLPSI